jgi:arginase family enzyme
MRSLIFVLLSLFACSLNGAFAQIQIDSIAKISDSITAQSFDVVEENPTQQAEKKTSKQLAHKFCIQ